MARRKRIHKPRQEVDWTPAACPACGSNIGTTKSTQTVREFDQDLGDRLVKRQYTECLCGHRFWRRHVVAEPDYSRLKGRARR